MQAKFEEIFSKYSPAPNKDYLTLKAIFRMMYANRNLMDFFGWFATFLEWGSLYWIAATDDVRTPFHLLRLEKLVDIPLHTITIRAIRSLDDV